MRENLNINENVLVLAERIQLQESFRKNLFKIYLTLTKRKYFLLEKSKKNPDKISYYWLKDSQNKKLIKGFQRAELLTINNNFTT